MAATTATGDRPSIGCRTLGVHEKSIGSITSWIEDIGRLTSVFVLAVATVVPTSG